MAKEDKQFLAFNRGIVSALGLSRIDTERLAMSAETMTNWMPRVLGSMMLRCGLQYITSTASDLKARLLPFIFSISDQAQIELTAALLRVRVSDVLITRSTTTAVIANGTFTSDLASWTDADQSGAASTWLTGGYMALLGDGTNYAIRRQTLTINETGVEHAVRVIVNRGPVLFRIGSTSGGEELFTESALETGEHSLTFTPAASPAYLEFASDLSYTVLVDSIAVEAAGIMTLPTPWTATDLPNVRMEQSGDIIYMACDGVKQQKIERRSTNAWSVVDYIPVNGPFEILNVTQTTIAPSAVNGDVTLTASRGIFKSSHVGALFSIDSNGQKVSSAISAADSFSNSIKVIGIEAQRIFNIDITGTFVGTITVQYSVGVEGSWVDLTTSYTVPVSTTYDDKQDEQEIYYRIGIKTGDYTSGTATCILTYGAGSITGVARVTVYSSITSVSAVVLKDFGGTVASADWREGSWGTRLGWPTAVRLFEGRLWWAGRDKIWGSVSDNYENFDPDVLGNAGLISRNIGIGPIQSIHWLLPLGRLIIGAALNSADVDAVLLDGNNPLSALSSSFGNPLTPSNFNLKGLALRGIFVDRTKQRLFDLQYDSAVRSIGSEDYIPADLSILTPDLNESGIVQIAAQMKPDIRIHCVRSDGKVAVLIFDRAEDVICWILVETNGSIEDVSILPNTVEDQVYYVVRRTVNGSTVRFVEKWSLESDCQGGDLNKQADAFVVYDSTATTTPFTTELLHLRGETVVIWADGKDVGTQVVTAAGALTSPLATAASKVMVGLTYTAQFKSSKLASITGSGLNVKRMITQMGVVLRNTHYQGLKYGPDFSTLFDLPQVEDGQVLASDTIHSTYDEERFAFGGDWDTDARLCLQATSPRPCTVLSSVVEVESHK